jgi:putative SOS response-associated peptidase YedK
MCGRVTLEHLTWAQVFDWMNLIPGHSPDAEIAQGYNIPPTSALPILRLTGGTVQAGLARWGLVPGWHRGTLRDWKATTINARAEEVTQKPSFRSAYARGRCVVLASGYYEWQVSTGVKQPFYIHPAGNAPALLMAGLVSDVELADFAGLTCAVMTEAVRPPLDAVHDRIPVLLPPDGVLPWLQGVPVEQVARLPMAGLAWHRVGRAVNSVRNDGPDLIEPIDRAGLL